MPFLIKGSLNCRTGEMCVGALIDLKRFFEPAGLAQFLSSNQT